MSIKLRRATVWDIPRIVGIERKVFPKPWGWDAFLSELLKPYSRVLVAHVEGKLVGYCVLWLFPPEAYIANIAVEPSYQGMGVGTALMEKVEEICRDEGISSITLEVRASNRVAQSLYRKFGFEVVGVRRAMYHDGEDGLVMEKLI